jgi:4-hydroxy-tetrahydrodipicolinate synthase
MPQRLNEDASGVYIISTTPFADDGALDLDSLDSLTDEETRWVLARVLRRVDGRVPVAVGVSNAGFNKLLALVREAMGQGAAGIMVTPQISVRFEAGILDCMWAIVEALGNEVPICYQDFPLSTNVPISAEAFTRLLKAMPSIVMLKHKDGPGLQKLSKVRSATRLTRRLEPLEQAAAEMVT